MFLFVADYKKSWMKEDKGLKAEIDEIEEKLTCVKGGPFYSQS